MELYDRIRERRITLGLSQEELAYKLGYKDRSTIAKIESGKNDITQSKIGAFASALDTTPAYLMGWDGEACFEPQDNAPQTKSRKELLQIDDRLSDSGHKEWIKYGNYLVNQPEYSLSEEESRRRLLQRDSSVSRQTEDEPILFIRHYFTPSAAGYAAPIEGEDFELIEAGSSIPKNADFCIDVSGDSMEPYIKAGQRVYVQRDASLIDFDVGVFYYDGDVYIKQFCVDFDGAFYLLSANPKRENANKRISRSANSTLICFGKVILPHKLPQPRYR